MPIKIKVIKTEEDYKEALEAIRLLMLMNPESTSDESEQIGVLATLIEDFETKNFPSSLPDPVDAILFRMEQRDLKPIDLVPYIGSRSKVSEILSRKRPLTLSMIRSLESGLDIPAKLLLTETDDFRDTQSINWSRFPLKEMERRDYFPKGISDIANIESAMKKFFEPIGGPTLVFGMLRKTNFRSIRPMDKYALTAWSAKIMNEATASLSSINYIDGTVNLDFMRTVAKLSSKSNGPILAQEFLKEHGIQLLIEPCFQHTYLDGASLFIDQHHPVIGLTLRKDALDNFWFSLMHELAHIALHLKDGCNLFYDNLDSSESLESKEEEADDLAREVLVPENKWQISPAKTFPSFMAAKSLAKDLDIHIVIVAGKMRYEGGKYTYLNKIVSQEKVRHYFPNKYWS